MSAPISVMIIDDSASVRAALASLIREDPGLLLLETAADPYEAAEKMRQKLPDVLLLDLHMPRMDGLTFLKKIMSQRPMPVVVISSFVQEGSEESLRALELGAAEVLLKPRIGSPQERAEAAVRISDAIRAAVQARRGAKRGAATPAPAKPLPLAPGARHSADVILPKPTSAPRSAPPLIAIGASTGGTEALRVLFEALPAGLPPIAVVQHMPEGFTRAFAERLNRGSAVEVFEAAEGATLRSGQAVIARGDHHMALSREGAGYRIGLREGPCVARHRPSVDVLFRSVATVAGSAALGVILTGMGDDGAEGMGEMVGFGARTIAQDEESSVVFGMPRVAIERGFARRVLPLERIAAEIRTWAAQNTQSLGGAA